MTVPCTGWCGLSAPSESQDRCSGCLVLEKSFFAIDPSQRPNSKQRRTASERIDPARGLSSDQMFLSIADSFNEKSLPDSFKASRGSPGNLSRHIAEKWAEAKTNLSFNGRMVADVYPLPNSGGTCYLQVKDDGSIAIDGVRLTGPLPMADICDWLSNPSRLGTIRSWKNFLIALSNCCVRFPLNSHQDDWPRHLFTRGWDGIDAPDPSVGMEFPGSNLHPFLKTIAMISGRDPSIHCSLGHIARTSPIIITRFGGEAGTKWLELIRRGNRDEFRRLHNITIHPRLVVDENSRMRMIVLRAGSPTTVPVSVNPRVWRCLVHSLMFPEGNEEANLAKHLFWVWESEDSDWRPTLPQIKSSRMLRETIDSLGPNCSSEAVTSVSSEYPGICVIGSSGLAYHIQGRPSDGAKFIVSAYPSREHISKPSCQGIHLCIDSQKVGGLQLPAGDICASYVLSLRHDTISRHSIFTLEHLLQMCELTNESFDFKGDLDEWWENVSDNLAMFEEGGFFGQEGEQDEDWEADVPEGEPTPDLLPEDLEPPEEDHIRWSGAAIGELMENMRNLPQGMEEERS